MWVTGIGVAVLCLALGTFGCGGRRPLASGEVSVGLDASTAVIDAAPDRTVMAEASTAPTFAMIDDMEDHTNGLPTAPTEAAFFWQSAGAVHIGNWFVSSPEGSTRDAQRSLIDPSRGDSQNAREVRAGDTTKAINLWAQLDHPQGRAIDLSRYAGLVFWARLTGSGGILDVALDGMPGGGGVYFQSDFRSLPTWELFVPDHWQAFTLRFDDLPTPPTGVVSIDFVASTSAGPLDLWIDDVALLCRDACP
jgi:hypothetical protein